METVERLNDEQRQMVLDNQRLITYVLNKKMHVSHSHPMFEDYFQEGNIGLCLAAIRFDPSRGFQFSTYATPIIYGRIRYYKRSIDPPQGIKISRPVRERIYQTTQEQNCELDEADFSGEKNPAELREVADLLRGAIYSMDCQRETGKDGSTSSLADYLADDHDEIRLFETEQVISEYLESLPEKDQDIMYEVVYEAICGDGRRQSKDCLSRQTSLAQKYKISQSQVSRIIHRRMEELKNLLKG